MSTAQRILKRLRHGGLPWVAGALRDRIRPARPSFFDSAASSLHNCSAIELGGPSRLFRPSGGLPAYAWLARLDNVNFTSSTPWENDLRDGGEFRFHPAKPPGRQFLREATHLEGIADASYDAVLSSHCLEHVADPLRALGEWSRVVRPGGCLLLALPDPARTFDHRRPVTTLDHLRGDFKRATAEDDLSHLDEVLSLHDLDLDPSAGTPVAFAARCRDNFRQRCMHHHVFDRALIQDCLAESGWECLAVEKLAPLHWVAFARRTTAKP